MKQVGIFEILIILKLNFDVKLLPFNNIKVNLKRKENICIKIHEQIYSVTDVDAGLQNEIKFTHKLESIWQHSHENTL